jgi:hypothetical protein
MVMKYFELKIVITVGQDFVLNKDFSVSLRLCGEAAAGCYSTVNMHDEPPSSEVTLKK